ncbi:hypothetical protein [Pseudomonas entomophila]|uniref:hypothetical protein n=1 Tax=Pseudomonas entomophila TaxID=312306 RepID=UPI001F0263EB|nr:hypothetical protein [Pseudomonas entomophila]MCG8291418.1 hypothetical protein [Pseudomonas entomophila]
MPNAITLRATSALHIDCDISASAFEKIKKSTSEKEATCISIWRKIADLFCGTDTANAYRLLYRITHAEDYTSALSTMNELQALSRDPDVFEVLHGPNSRTVTIKISDIDAFTAPATYSELKNQEELLSPDIESPLTQAFEDPSLKGELNNVSQKLNIAHEANTTLANLIRSTEGFTSADLQAAHIAIDAEAETLKAIFAKNSAIAEYLLAQAVVNESNHQSLVSTLNKELHSKKDAITELEQSIQDKECAKKEIIATINRINEEKNKSSDLSNYNYLLTATPGSKFVVSLYGKDANDRNRQFIAALASTTHKLCIEELEKYNEKLTDTDKALNEEAALFKNEKTKEAEIQAKLSDAKSALAKAKQAISSLSPDKEHIESLINQSHNEKPLF